MDFLVKDLIKPNYYPTLENNKFNPDIVNILKEVLKAVKSWKKIANDIGISRAEQEIMSSAFQYMIE